MKLKKERKYVFIFTLALVCLLFLFTLKQTSSRSKTALISENQPVSKSLFRQTLEEKCYKNPDLTEIIAAKDLPFTIDQKVVKLQPFGKSEAKNVLVCQKQYGIAIAETEDNKEIWMTDDKFELSEDRKNPGLEIGQKENVRLFIKLILPSGGVPEGHYSTISDRWVEIYGVREFKLKNGEIVLLTYDQNGIVPPDQSLFKLLKEYSTAATASSKNPELDFQRFKIEDIEADIAKTFFSDIINLAPNEKKAVDEVYSTLNAFKP